MKSVLEWVNDIRKDFDGEPLDDLCKGGWGSPVVCPLAVSIGKDLPVKVYVYRTHADVISGEGMNALHTHFPTSKEADRFIEGFDGRYAHQEYFDGQN